MKSDAYHHGDLRRALMDEALGLVRERGLPALSLREVAARAGVSTAAPYHHFADKAALVRALGYEALAELDRRMAVAEAGAAAAPYERLLALGSAYIAFACERPEYAALMRAPEMAAPQAPDDVPEHGRSRERLLAAVVACQEAGILTPGDPLPPTIGMWALVQGLAELLATAPASLAEQYGGKGALIDAVLRAVVPPAGPCIAPRFAAELSSASDVGRTP
jgi:AcrR family transcriptional regulator